MATTVPTYAQSAAPKGDELTQTKSHSYGTVTIPAGGTYVTNGLPLTFSGPDLQFASLTPIWGDFNSTSGLIYVWDLAHSTIRIFYVFGTEVANGATVNADSVQAHFVFNRD